MGVSAPAQAAAGNILPPFDVGQTWNICQGYNNPNVTHTGTSSYGLDLTGAGCDNSASGRNVRASMSGTVAYYQATYGNLCINVDDGRSYTLTHIDSSITSGTVTAGQLVGTVAAPGQRGNNGVAHIHFQMWSTSNCYSSSGIPFDSAHNARICGAPDLIANGPTGTGNGTWSGTSFIGESCGNIGAVSSSIVFTNGGGETYANANPSTSTWTKLSNTTDDISASGSCTAWIDGCEAAWATSNFASVTATQITPCNGATAIAIGSQGNLVFIDSCGSAHATNTYTNPQSWVTLTGCNGAVEIAAGGGGTGRVAVINGCGALNVTVNYQTWTQIAGCGGAQEVAIGPNGTLAFINGCGALNATTNYTNASAWVAIAGCGGATQLAVGTDKRLVFADGCGSAHGTMTYDSASSWVILTGCGGAQAIAMGTAGQTAVINGCGALNVTSNFQSWMSIAPCNGATRVAVS